MTLDLVDGGREENLQLAQIGTRRRQILDARHGVTGDADRSLVDAVGAVGGVDGPAHEARGDGREGQKQGPAWGAWARRHGLGKIALKPAVTSRTGENQRARQASKAKRRRSMRGKLAYAPVWVLLGSS